MSEIIRCNASGRTRSGKCGRFKMCPRCGSLKWKDHFDNSVIENELIESDKEFHLKDETYCPDSEKVECAECGHIFTSEERNKQNFNYSLDKFTYREFKLIVEAKKEERIAAMDRILMLRELKSK